jgi:hypothetical protein
MNAVLALPEAQQGNFTAMTLLDCSDDMLMDVSLSMRIKLHGLQYSSALWQCGLKRGELIRLRKFLEAQGRQYYQFMYKAYKEQPRSALTLKYFSWKKILGKGRIYMIVQAFIHH